MQRCGVLKSLFNKGFAFFLSNLETGWDLTSTWVCFLQEGAQAQQLPLQLQVRLFVLCGILSTVPFTCLV